MKVLAIIANFGVIIFLIVVLFLGKVWNEKASELLLFLAWLLFPIINLMALFSISGINDFFSLFCERKRLEQEKKILELKKEIESKKGLR